MDLLYVDESEIRTSSRANPFPWGDPSRIAGLWRRFLSWATDTIVIFLIEFSLVGMASGDPWKKSMKMGPWFFVLNYVISVFYRGIMESELFDGQSLGKYSQGIRVVNLEGECLPLGLSLLRAGLSSLNYIALFTPNLLFIFMPLFVIFNVFTLALSYETRRAIHDRLAGAFVVRDPERRKHALNFNLVAMFLLAPAFYLSAQMMKPLWEVLPSASTPVVAVKPEPVPVVVESTPSVPHPKLSRPRNVSAATLSPEIESIIVESQNLLPPLRMEDSGEQGPSQN